MMTRASSSRAPQPEDVPPAAPPGEARLTRSKRKVTFSEPAEEQHLHQPEKRQRTLSVMPVARALNQGSSDNPLAVAFHPLFRGAASRNT